MKLLLNSNNEAGIAIARFGRYQFTGAIGNSK